MESVREWAAAVCCACIVSAMLSMVFPGGSNKKLLGTVLSVMMMCIVFQPIVALRNLASELKDYSFDVMQYRNEGSGTRRKKRIFVIPSAKSEARAGRR